MFLRERGEEVIQMGEIGASSYRRFLQGDQAALEELIRTYSDELVRYAFTYVRSADVAEELVSDVFAALFMKRKVLGREELLRAYLYKMTRSRAIDRLRRFRRETPLEDVEQVLWSRCCAARIWKLCTCGGSGTRSSGSAWMPFQASTGRCCSCFGSMA